MYIDLLNDLFLNSTVFYLFFGLLLTTIGMSQLTYLGSRLFTAESTSLMMTDYSYVKVNAQHLIRPLYIGNAFITWLIIVFKRIDLPDDDKEAPSNSNLNHVFTIRGGQIWRSNMYSLSLKRFVM